MNRKLVVNILQSLPKLMRLGVSIAVAFSAATGYLVYKPQFDLTLLFIVIGVFLLSGGASALNQYQERHTDALMLRTTNRPIPSKKISSTTGLIIAIVLCLLGFVILYTKTGETPALLGFLNLIAYNGFYTYLKRKSAFAVFPGSLTGVAPILIGWSAVNTNLLDPVIILISFFMFMWQIPHFWLILIKYNDEYINAGLGSIYRTFSGRQVKRIVFAWIIATSLTSLMLPYFGIIQSVILIVVLIAMNVWIAISFYQNIFDKTDYYNFKKAFISINVFMILVMSFLIVESMIS